MIIATIMMAGAEATSHAPAGITLNFTQILYGLRVLIAGAAILVGLFFLLAGTLGVLRLPDFYTRIHAAGMTDTLGAELILLGLMVQSGFSQMTLKLLFVAFFLLLTGPTATHAVANAAYRAGLKPQLGPYRAPDVDTIRKAGRPGL
ncbi:monovalent cation/H(+) antiporter subunit G [Fretibacter rubidus]|uniref:monovalent cation/H(+) antiporter subunit G n=1 Tax=Fretibacter rubidus TaxID=570162 RepID=UPI00352A35D7